MPVAVLDEKLWFPDVAEAEPDGLLAIGGNLSEDRLLAAYKKGIFPWFEGDIPLWWCPDPRFVLFPEDIKVSKSMRHILRSQVFTFKMNTAFADVIHHCKNVRRKQQSGTWITDEVEEAYISLHKKNYAFSAEAWQDNTLVGGLYGIRLGNVFFGESMFGFISNASKFAFIKYTEHLQNENVKLIDCQVYTEHLESLGAQMISRTKFLSLIDKLIG